MIEDLLTSHEGFAIAEREVEPKEIGGSPRHLRHRPRGGARRPSARRDDPEVDTLEKADRLLYVRSTSSD